MSAVFESVSSQTLHHSSSDNTSKMYHVKTNTAERHFGWMNPKMCDALILLITPDPMISFCVQGGITSTLFMIPPAFCLIPELFVLFICHHGTYMIIMYY